MILDSEYYVLRNKLYKYGNTLDIMSKELKNLEKSINNNEERFNKIENNIKNLQEGLDNNIVKSEKKTFKYEDFVESIERDYSRINYLKSTNGKISIDDKKIILRKVLLNLGWKYDYLTRNWIKRIRANYEDKGIFFDIESRIQVDTGVQGIIGVELRNWNYIASDMTIYLKNTPENFCDFENALYNNGIECITEGYYSIQVKL